MTIELQISIAEYPNLKLRINELQNNISTP